MKRKQALFCLNCEEVFESTRPNECPVCGSTQWVPLGRWLRDTETAREKAQSGDFSGAIFQLLDVVEGAIA